MGLRITAPKGFQLSVFYLYIIADTLKHFKGGYNHLNHSINDLLKGYYFQGLNVNIQMKFLQTYSLYLFNKQL